MTPAQLQCVLAVAADLHFTRAAAQLGMAQSALSHQVATLEAELGTRLFERTSRRVRLTAAGAALLPRARTVLAELDRLRTDVVAAGGAVAGRLRIGTVPTLPEVRLADVLADLLRHHPAVRAHVAVQGSDTTLAGVADGSLDVGFVGLAMAEPPAGVERRLLAVERHVAVVAAGDPWRGRRRVRLRDVAARPCVDFPAGTGGRRQTDAAFAAASLVRDVVVESDDVGLVLDLVRRGTGTALLPASAVLDRAGLHTVAVVDGPARRSSVLHAGDGASAATRAFLAVLDRHLPAGPGPAARD
ncbi:LysR substrate-binding domain-containing protein [Kineococcus sp. LSe6-4]|uniref:LysR substrate-binding domain-containing protein n=1 Tax=Kineococcus halophytocola TaxID=3234027 RepID=A0ABV4H2E7_9ACTN